jgi:hypothetical protein
MNQKEEQEDLAGKIIKSIETIDAMLNDRMQFGLNPVGSEGVKKTFIAGELGGNKAAVGTWLGHYLRTSIKEYYVFNSLVTSHSHLSKVPSLVAPSSIYVMQPRRTTTHGVASFSSGPTICR